MLVTNKKVKTPFCLMRGAEPEVAAARGRLANVERLRILSASGVVCFHAFSESSLARSFGTVGILIFLLSFCAFIANRAEPYDLSEILKRKARRLLKPWLFWSLIYGLIVVAKVILRSVPISEAFNPTMLVVGTRTHLWFLPFAFAAAVVVALIRKKTGDTPRLLTIVAAILIGTLCVCTCAILQSRFGPPTPVQQWILGVPAIAFGLALGRITLLRKDRDRRNLYAFATLMTTAACIVIVLLCDDPRLAFAGKFMIRYCVSVGLLCIAFNWKGSLDPVSKKLASLSYGVYLVHPLVLILLCELRIAVHHRLVLFLLAVFVSGAITEVLKKTALRQFV